MYNANDCPPSSHWGRVLLPEPGLNHCKGVSRVFLKHFVLKSLKDKPAPQPASSGDDCHQARYPAPNHSGKLERENRAAECGRAAPLPLPGWEGVWEAQRERAELCRTQGGAERCSVSPALCRVLGWGVGGHHSAPRQPPLPLTAGLEEPGAGVPLRKPHRSPCQRQVGRHPQRTPPQLWSNRRVQTDAVASRQGPSAAARGTICVSSCQGLGRTSSCFNPSLR